ncbi:MAG: hypothetical protein PHI98_14600 [Eubacteriales bacterium]|nr:hypothetical protein [Eubacteriales bacterium]
MKKWTNWQIGKMIIAFVLTFVIGGVYLFCAATLLYQDRAAEDFYWQAALDEEQESIALFDSVGGDPIEVLCGNYIENLKEVSIKGSYFRLEAQIWFRWQGDPSLDMMNHFRFYRGTINKMTVIKDYHQGDDNYQLVRCDVTITKQFWTRRFPLESHQLRMYLVSNFSADQVRLVADKENSSLNSGLSIAGFDIRRVDYASIAYMQNGTHSDPELSSNLIQSECLTQIELNRSNWGMYARCFMALIGTITWVMISLFLNSYHEVNPLGMLPAALFGTVTNIAVGASFLADGLEMGLLELVNIWGIMTIIIVTISIININRIRDKYHDARFATFYGRTLFYLMLFFVALGNILLPVVAYMW